MPHVFFHFINDPTYHCFEWVRAGGLGDVPTLLTEAYHRVEASPWLEMGEDVCSIARSALAELLLERLSSLELPFPEGPGIGDVWKELDGLTDGLLGWALNQISFETVAEALLREAGKWAPSKDFPEISDYPKKSGG